MGSKRLQFGRNEDPAALLSLVDSFGGGGPDCRQPVVAPTRSIERFAPSPMVTSTQAVVPWAGGALTHILHLVGPGKRRCILPKGDRTLLENRT